MSKRVLASAALVLALAAPQARADTWGCEVLLCLSNPAGPMAVAACVPPITRLYKAIFKWKPDPFPTCLMSDGADSAAGGNYAYVGAPSYYDACPAGTTPAADGSTAAMGRPMTPAELAANPVLVQGSAFVLTSGFVKGIGDGSSYQPAPENPLPTKVCVGKALGQTTQTVGSTIDDLTQITVDVYDQVVLIDPASDTFNINVMINNRLFRNIRPFSQPAMHVLVRP